MSDNRWVQAAFRVQAKAGAAVTIAETPSRLAVRVEITTPDGDTRWVELTKSQWEALGDLRWRVTVEAEPEMVEEIRAAGLDALPEDQL